MLVHKATSVPVYAFLPGANAPIAHNLAHTWLPGTSATTRWAHLLALRDDPPPLKLLQGHEALLAVLDLGEDGLCLTVVEAWGSGSKGARV